MPIIDPPEGYIIVDDEHPFPDDPEYQRAFSLHVMRTLARLYAQHMGLKITGERIREPEPGRNGRIRIFFPDGKEETRA